MAEMNTSVTWTCQTCSGAPAFDHESFLEHLKEVHGIDPHQTKGERSLCTHVDARDEIINIYTWKIGWVSAVQDVTVPRRQRR